MSRGLLTWFFVLFGALCVFHLTCVLGSYYVTCNGSSSRLARTTVTRFPQKGPHTMTVTKAARCRAWIQPPLDPEDDPYTVLLLRSSLADSTFRSADLTFSLEGELLPAMLAMLDAIAAGENPAPIFQGTTIVTWYPPGCLNRDGLLAVHCSSRGGFVAAGVDVRLTRRYASSIAQTIRDAEPIY